VAELLGNACLANAVWVMPVVAPPQLSASHLLRTSGRLTYDGEITETLLFMVGADGIEPPTFAV
jgi:hypothetical protein